MQNKTKIAMSQERQQKPPIIACKMKQIQQNLAGAFAAAAIVTASTPKIISESDAYH